MLDSPKERKHGHGCHERIDTRVPVSSIGRDPKVRTGVAVGVKAFVLVPNSLRTPITVRRDARATKADIRGIARGIKTAYFNKSYPCI